MILRGFTAQSAAEFALYLVLGGADAAGVDEDAAGADEEVDSVFELAESDFEESLFASVFDSPGLLEFPFA
ncbi:MAG TPA: hypothetical protein VHC90_19145 [Bryobacteraceae bacterium]|nr:hypothetical protein [Bryobacteraceae bacterium]